MIELIKIVKNKHTSKCAYCRNEIYILNLLSLNYLAKNWIYTDDKKCINCIMLLHMKQKQYLPYINAYLQQFINKV